MPPSPCPVHPVHATAQLLFLRSNFKHFLRATCPLCMYCMMHFSTQMTKPSLWLFSTQVDSIVPIYTNPCDGASISGSCFNALVFRRSEAGRLMRHNDLQSESGKACFPSSKPTAMPRINLQVNELMSLYNIF